MIISLEEAIHKNLENMFPDGIYALDFKNEHYSELLKRLSAGFSADKILKRRGTIHREMSNHFSKSDQKISIIFHSGQIVVQKEFDEDSYDEEEDRRNYIINSKLKEIIKNPDQYKPVSNMWIIPESHKDELVSAYSSMSSSTNEIREFLKHNLHTQFLLNHRDIIFFLREKIFIREYTSPRKVPEGADKRYAGLDHDDVVTLYKKHFPVGVEDKIEAILPEILSDKLNFSIIDNATFIRDFIPVFRSMVEIIILEHGLDLDDITLEGLSGYILRINLDLILLICAQDLFKHIENRDRNAEKFIKYYSDDVVIDSKHKRVQKYAIVDKKGQKWNYTSILSIIIQNKESDKKILRQEQQIDMIKGRFDIAGNKLIDAEKRKQAITEKSKDINLEIKSLEMQIQSVNIRNTHRSRKEVETEKLSLQRKRLNLLDSKKFLVTKKDQIEREYRNTNTEFTNWENRLRKEKKLLTQMRASIVSLKESYEILLHAMVVTFMKR